MWLFVLLQILVTCAHITSYRVNSTQILFEILVDHPTFFLFFLVFF